ncbi:hypothetical protein [Jiella pelagia]|uniref:Uncharacterized protein n=1 Tax=Jiella pelagia TaxID=2986949 RepID=A0ABY7C4C0_9HYPH|nr:hypothetical protein [Jiella pelagia]WAP70677.1 hypothetical protein OH818_12055 [Jiella pelagia]
MPSPSLGQHRLRRPVAAAFDGALAGRCVVHMGEAMLQHGDAGGRQGADEVGLHPRRHGGDRQRQAVAPRHGDQPRQRRRRRRRVVVPPPQRHGAALGRPSIQFLVELVEYLHLPDPVASKTAPQVPAPGPSGSRHLAPRESLRRFH